jgi:outer membrane protein OmpA-like peptidoglycan-associated protein
MAARDRARRLPPYLLLAIGACCLAAPVARAQRGAAPDVPSLIEQLSPGTRGIRVPQAEPPSAGAQPSSPATEARPPSASLTVRFATGSAALTPEARATLDVLGQALTAPQLAPYRFRIEGHTDTVGSAETNRVLSEHRADAVRDYLAAHFGIAANRIESVGLGEAQPAVPTPDETPEARNRRVQIVNIGS